MANGPAVNSNTIVDELLKFKKERAKGFGINRQNFSGIGSSSGLGSAGSKGGDTSQGGSGSAYLKTGGDTMIGPIAYFPKAATIATGVLDVGENTLGFSSRVVVSGEGGIDDDLVTIANVAHAGQMLFLQPILTSDITLKHNVDNIWSPTLADVIVPAGHTTILQWDTVVHANKWIIISGVGAGDNLGDHTATQDIDMKNFNIISSIAPTGGDQFRIIFDAELDSDTYIANTTVADVIQVVNNGAITVEFRDLELYVDKPLNMNLNNINFGGSSATTGLIRMVNSTDLRWGASPSNVDREGLINYDVDENFLFTSSGEHQFYIGDAVKANVLNITTSGIDLLGNTLDNVHENTIINATTTATVDGAADWLLIADVDGAGTEWFKIHPDDLGVGGDNLGNHTATQDIDMQNSNIISTLAPTVGDQFRIIFDAHLDSDTYIANLNAVADTIQVVTNGSIITEFRPSELWVDSPLDMNLNNINFGASSALSGLIRLVNSTDLAWAASPSNADREGTINYDVGENFDYTASGVHRFWIGDAGKTEVAEFTTSGLDMQDNDVSNWNDLISGTAFPAAIGGLRLATTERVAWRNSDNSADIFITNSGVTSMIVSGNWLPSGGSTFDLGSSGVRWSDLFSVGADLSGTLLVAGTATFNGAAVNLGNASTDEVRIRGFTNVVSIVEPSAPISGETTIFHDSADGELKVKKFGGTVVSLEGGGGLPHNDDVAHIIDAGASTATLRFDLSGSTTAQNNVLAMTSTGGAKTWTLPNVTGTLMSLSGTQTISGAKTFSSTIVSTNATNAMTCQGDIDMNGNDIVDIEAINFNNNAAFATPSANVFELVVSGDKKFRFEEAGVQGSFIVETDTTGHSPRLMVSNVYTAIGDGDVIGILDFSGWDSGDNDAQWFSLRVEAADVTSSSKDSTVEFWLASANSSAGANSTFMQASGGGTSTVAKIGFRDATPQARATITGNTSTYVEGIITQLLTALDNMGLITDSTTT